MNKFGDSVAISKRTGENDSLRPAEFVCRACGEKVPVEAPGTMQRNHCPRCLCSVHLDESPGDRASHCGGIMEPIGVWVKKNGEWAIIHRCRVCGKLSANRIAGDDSELLLLSIALRPLASPPFPISEIGKLRIETKKGEKS